MKIKNFDELQNKADRELAWRRMDITQIRFNVESTESNTPAAEFAIRGGFMLLYADWEGFIRTVSNYYVIYVFSRHFKLKELSFGFWTIFNFTEFTEIKDSNKKALQMKFIENMVNNSEKITKKKYNDVINKRFINTHSNLTYDVFSEIMKVIGIENKFTLDEAYINNVLLKNRNSIAHGERLFLDKKEFLLALDRVNEILEIFKEEILNSAEKELYLIKNN